MIMARGKTKNSNSHQVNIHMVCAEKEFVRSQCLAAFRITGLTNNVVAWKEDCMKSLTSSVADICSYLKESNQRISD